MPDPPSYPDTDGTNRGSARRTPRRLLVLGFIIAVVLILLLVVLHLTGTLGPGAH